MFSFLCRLTAGIHVTRHMKHIILYFGGFFFAIGGSIHFGTTETFQTLFRSFSRECLMGFYIVPRLHILLQMQLCKQWNSVFSSEVPQVFFRIFKVFFFECIPRIKVKTLCRAAISIRCCINGVVFVDIIYNLQKITR